jgi:hypothetical protein
VGRVIGDPPQHDTEVVEVDGLQRNVVETRVAAEFAILFTTPPGQRNENHRVSPRTAADLGRHIEAAHAGHADIDERDIGKFFFDELNAVRAARCTVCVVAEELKHAQHAFNQVHVVVDYCDS